jgi:hypothetical protein
MAVPQGVLQFVAPNDPDAKFVADHYRYGALYFPRLFAKIVFGAGDFVVLEIVAIGLLFDKRPLPLRFPVSWGKLKKEVQGENFNRTGAPQSAEGEVVTGFAVPAVEAPLTRIQICARRVFRMVGAVNAGTSIRWSRADECRRGGRENEQKEHGASWQICHHFTFSKGCLARMCVRGALRFGHEVLMKTTFLQT